MLHNSSTCRNLSRIVCYDFSKKHGPFATKILRNWTKKRKTMNFAILKKWWLSSNQVLDKCETVSAYTMWAARRQIGMLEGIAASHNLVKKSFLRRVHCHNLHSSCFHLGLNGGNCCAGHSHLAQCLLWFPPQNPEIKTKSISASIATNADLVTYFSEKAERTRFRNWQ